MYNFYCIGTSSDLNLICKSINNYNVITLPTTVYSTRLHTHNILYLMINNILLLYIV